MAFSESFLEEINEKNPIEDVVGAYVNLTRRGSNLFGLCPFHNEKTASFSVVPGKSMYYCFGCHKGGGVVNFIMEIEGLEYPDAVAFLAKRAGIRMPEEDQQQSSNLRYRERLWSLCRAAAQYYHSMLKSPQGQVGLRYLLERGLTQKTITRFGLGFAPDSWDGLKKAMLEQGFTIQELQDAGLVRTKRREVQGQDGSLTQQVSTYDWFRNRVMFPIIDVRGNVIGFGGRVMDHSEPKYLNSPESVVFNKRKNLFALNVAKKTKMGMLVLTEGYMDTISMHQYGFDCAVASLGTSLTQEQARVLARYTKQMVLCYDGDEAGQRAAKRAIEILRQVDVEVRVLQIQGAKDPDEFLKKYGRERFGQLLGTSKNDAVYQIDTVKAKYDVSTDEGRVAFLKEAAALVAAMPSSIDREVYGGRVAEIAKVSQEVVKLEVQRVKRGLQKQQKKAQEKKDLRPVEQVQPSDSKLKYTNVKSARAEEGLISQLLLEPGLMDAAGALKPQDFSVPMFGKLYGWMKERWQAGQSISISLLAGAFTPEEISHITRVSQSAVDVVNEKAVSDYISVIRQEAEKSGNRDLMAALNRCRDKKGYGG